MVERETSAAIAERVANERAVTDEWPVWAELSTSTRRRLVAFVDAGRASVEPRTIPPLTDAEILGLLSHYLKSRSVKDAYALAASRLGATVAAPVPEPPSVTVAPVEYEWHDDGFKKQVYAEKATGRIVGSVDNQSAYIVGSGFVGLYVTPQQARDAVVRVLALREGRGDDGKA